jgi:hypothetical protein
MQSTVLHTPRADWLDSAPLVAAVEALQLERGIPLARLIRRPSLLRDYRRARTDGRITAYRAGKLCRSLRLGPCKLYGAAYAAAVAASPPPARPPGDAPQPRIEMGPLAETIGAILARRHADLAWLLGRTGQRAYERGQAEGTLPLTAAERLCDLIGQHPRQVWGDRYDELAALTFPPDAPDDLSDLQEAC